jgi:hypothetical protein
MVLVLATGLRAGIIQTVTAVVCTEPVRLVIGEGQFETLQVMLVNAKKIYGIDLQASFDPTVVQVVDGDPKHTGIQMTPGAFLKPDYTVRNSVDNQNGTLRYIVTQVNPTPPVTGKGIILSIQFRGTARGSSSKFAITSAVIADRHGNKQPVSIQGAELVIVPQKPPTPTGISTQTRNHVPTKVAAAARIQITTHPPTRARATATRNAPARVAVRPSGAPDQVLTYLAIGGFAGAALLSSLSVWLLMAKRCKQRKTKAK